MNFPPACVCSVYKVDSRGHYYQQREERQIALAHIMRLVGLPDDNCFTAPAAGITLLGFDRAAYEFVGRHRRHDAG